MNEALFLSLSLYLSLSKHLVWNIQKFAHVGADFLFLYIFKHCLKMWISLDMMNMCIDAESISLKAS